jgi:cytochrome c
MTDDHDIDREPDNDDEDEDDKRRLKKHKKKIQWLIDYIEGKAGKGGKAIIKDDNETQNVVAYLEKLHNAIEQELDTAEHHKEKKKVKDRKGKGKKPTEE